MDEYEVLFKDREHAALYRAMKELFGPLDERVESLETSRKFVRRSLKFAGWLVGVLLTLTSILVWVIR